ncbi:MAG: YecA family protein [Acidimicrobiales bacterium]
MGKVGRNGPCPCGSGLKAKLCCLAAESARVTTPRATLARLQPEVAEALDGVDKETFRELYDEMIYLPELDVSLHVRLPGLLTPEIDAAINALSDEEDHECFDEALFEAAQALDSTEGRLELAEAVLALRDRGIIPPALAAVAIFDLNQEDSALFISSLAQAIAVQGGEEPTPSGLLVATR